MGCIECRLLNPRPPDPSIRAFWNVRGLLLDGKDGIERRPPGIVYVCNGKLCYTQRHCVCSKQRDPIEVDLTAITSIFAAQQFTSDVAPSEVATARVVDISSSSNGTSFHFGLVLRQSEQVCSELNDIIRKHRQKPKIIQFNSIDIEGVEIDLP